MVTYMTHMYVAGRDQGGSEIKVFFRNGRKHKKNYAD